MRGFINHLRQHVGRNRKTQFVRFHERTAGNIRAADDGTAQSFALICFCPCKSAAACTKRHCDRIVVAEGKIRKMTKSCQPLSTSKKCYDIRLFPAMEQMQRLDHAITARSFLQIHIVKQTVHGCGIRHVALPLPAGKPGGHEMSDFFFIFFRKSQIKPASHTGRRISGKKSRHVLRTAFAHDIDNTLMFPLSDRNRFSGLNIRIINSKGHFHIPQQMQQPFQTFLRPKHTVPPVI